MDIKYWINRIGNWLILSPTGNEGNEESLSPDRMLQEAYQELVQAQNLFSRVEDPDMIDYAIYAMKAAEERYDYLIKSCKAQYQIRGSLPIHTLKEVGKNAIL